MRRPLALALATAFVLLSVVVAPIVYLLWAIQQPTIVFRQVDPDMLYAMAIPGIVIELEKDRGVRAMDGTVLELDRRDLTRILTTMFSPDQALAKGHEALEAIATRLEAAPPDTFQFYISIADERRQVNQFLPGYFRRKLHSREPCQVDDVLGMAWTGIQKLFGKKMTDEEQLERLPMCDPPGPVEDAVIGAVRERLRQNEVRGPDSIRVRPAFSAKAHHHIRAALDLGREGAMFLPVLPLLLAGITVLSLNSRRDCYARLAGTLLASALLLLVLTVPLGYFAKDLDLYTLVMRTEGGGMSESTGQWLLVVFHVLSVTVAEAAWQVGLAAAFMLLAGLVLLRQHQRCPTATPAPQIDTPLRAELASRVSNQPT